MQFSSPRVMSPRNEPPSSEPSYSLEQYSSGIFSPGAADTSEYASTSFISSSSELVTRGDWTVPADGQDGDPRPVDIESSWDLAQTVESENASQASPFLKKSRGHIVRIASPTEGQRTPEPKNKTHAKGKTPRARQACESCRVKKSKCDERYPKCTNCVDLNVPCVIKENKSARRAQSFDEILKVLGEVANRVSEMSENTREGPSFPSDEHICRIVRTVYQSLKQSEPASSYYAASMVNETTPGDTPSQVHFMAEEKIVDVLQGNLSMPQEHSTPAHKLVENWPGIRSFYTGLPLHYVMQQEWDREPLALSANSVPKSKPALSRRACSPYSLLVHDKDTIRDPVQIDQDLNIESYPIPSRHADDPTGLLRIEFRKAQGMWKSFLENIHKLHPFLDIRHVGELIERFNLSSLRGGRLQRSSTFRAGGKRKRIDDACEEYRGDKNSQWWSTSARVQKATDTAIVLLVFALGDICQAEDLGGSEEINTFSTTSDECSFEAKPVLTAAPLIRYSTFAEVDLHVDEPSQHGQSDRISLSASETPEGFISIDAKSHGVPGLAYYIAASKILGQLGAGTHLPCVHAKLLAGLYAAQLLRPKESWKWISDAGSSMLIVLKTYPQCLDLEQQSAWLNSIRITYWTCLQLESDLLAEFDFPPSGISRFEEQVPVPFDHESIPRSIRQHSIDTKSIMTCFAQQIYLRKVLNRVHTALYSTDGTNISKRGWGSLTTSCLLDSLEDWRFSLRKDNLRPLWWEDSDGPSSDMNLARMRAKYYGGKVIMNRGFLSDAINKSEPIASSQNTSFTSDISRASSLSAETKGSSELAALDNETRKGANRCVSALIQSTIAFDNLITMPRRLIVTNLFGTAQAQFGNLLVLGAVIKSGSFSTLIPLGEFERLLRRTIDFLAHLAPMSDTMRKHLQVLHNIKKELIDG